MKNDQLLAFLRDHFQVHQSLTNETRIVFHKNGDFDVYVSFFPETGQMNIHGNQGRQVSDLFMEMLVQNKFLDAVIGGSYGKGDVISISWPQFQPKPQRRHPRSETVKFNYVPIQNVELAFPKIIFEGIAWQLAARGTVDDKNKKALVENRIKPLILSMLYEFFYQKPAASTIPQADFGPVKMTVGPSGLQSRLDLMMELRPPLPHRFYVHCRRLGARLLTPGFWR